MLPCSRFSFPLSSREPVTFCSCNLAACSRRYPLPFVILSERLNSVSFIQLFSAKRRTYVFRLLLNAAMFTFLFPSVILNGTPECFCFSEVLWRGVKEPRSGSQHHAVSGNFNDNAS